MMSEPLLLSAENISYSVEGVSLLENISINVKAGELVGLIGPNGAGKSTLLRCLTGVQLQDQGKVFYRQKLLDEYSLRDRAKLMGYLVQGAKAQWPLTVEKIIGLGRLPYQQWWQQSSHADKEYIEEALVKTETLAYRNRIVTTLSGGEQTLVMLARIFAACPQLIFADEPVAALDPYHQLHVMELLREHAQGEQGVVVVLHDLSLAARFCDRLYLLNHGELFCSGYPDTVLTAENMAEVYGVKTIVHHSEEGMSVAPISRLQQGHP